MWQNQATNPSDLTPPAIHTWASDLLTRWVTLVLAGEHDPIPVLKSKGSDWGGGEERPRQREENILSYLGSGRVAAQKNTGLGVNGKHFGEEGAFRWIL